MQNSESGTRLSFRKTEIPKGYDHKEYQRVYREFKDRGTEYANRNSKRKQNRAAEYLHRQFIGWDGEGYTDSSGVHHYAILANSVGYDAYDQNGLATTECFDLILDTAKEYKKAIHIIYGGGYDFNMMLRDLDKESLEKLYKFGDVTWNGYRIAWRPNKSLRIQQNEKAVTIYDILPFFQYSFVSACDQYLGNDWDSREQIIEEKKRRGQFTWDEIRSSVSDYNRAELRNLVALASELRSRLDRVGIRINRWDGPGAIAVALYQQHSIKDYMPYNTPKAVERAARYAYAGGRFEIIKQGISKEKVYEYDINSAYPFAIQSLPCLAHGNWELVRRPTTISSFGVYHIHYAADENDPYYSRPKPLWHRNPDGTITYHAGITGWYWSPEARLILDDTNATIIEGWEWHQSCKHKPFDWVSGMYLKRQALKKAKDGAQMGLKLGLNSLYGKLAQQIGARVVNGKWQIPPYHCMEWAGFITSTCRALVYRAAMQAPDEIIAFETDAVFSRVPLDLPISNRLGEFEETIFDSLTYIKSGMYYGTSNGEEIEKSRGFNKGTVTRQYAEQCLAKEAVIKAEHTQFITLGAALHTRGFDNWRHWITYPKQIVTMWWGGKRTPHRSNNAPWYQNLEAYEAGWWDTIPMPPVGEHSTEYAVAWVGEGRNFELDESVVDFMKLEEDEFYGD